ncbi:hypothetical protein AWH62_03290 [Maricaulis sp. W15]|uniref:Uncharacterized protein n=1 Tax=Maricaulis maris TaxID=74318 RepID=A0A495D289_9PROT|nr:MULTISPECIES: hypothetical protein [Maricaulis]OLF77710.1 hypothetical protein AWH62_03290 [Maricaulis sp. W15]RKQ95633.1 hypothetical protein C7435_2736 [Maricaulis maris]
MTSDVLDRIKTALTGRDGIDIGHFQWINLDMIKNEVGEQWIEVRKKIYSVSAQYIEKRLAKDDVLVRCRGGFILVFSTLSGADAVRKTAELSDGLNHYFLGDRILKNLEISSQTKELSVAEFAELVKRSDVSQAAEIGQASRSAIKVVPKTDAAGNWRDIDRRSGASTSRDLSKHKSPSLPDPALSQIVGDLPPSIDATADLDKLSTLPFKVPTAEWDEIIFKPSWDAKFKYITANFCLPHRHHNGTDLYGRQTLLGNRDPDILQAMDHAVATTAQRGFLKQLARGKKCAVVIPVNYETVIGTQDRIRYFSILQNIPQAQRKYFYIRVDNIPDGAPIGQMEELFRSMRIFGSNLLAKIEPGTVRLNRFENCSIAIYSSSLERKWAHTGLSDGVVKKLVDQAISIRRVGARGALTQVDTAEQLQFGIDAGYEIFTGAVIGKDMKTPAPLIETTLQSLLSRAA